MADTNKDPWDYVQEIVDNHKGKMDMTIAGFHFPVKVDDGSANDTYKEGPRIFAMIAYDPEMQDFVNEMVRELGSLQASYLNLRSATKPDNPCTGEEVTP